MARENSGERRRLIVELGNDLIDTMFRLRAHVRLTVDDARNGLYEYTGKFSYVEYGRSWRRLRNDCGLCGAGRGTRATPR